MKQYAAEEKIDVYRRDTCRLCGSKQIELVMPFPAIPSADDFVPINSQIEPQRCYPLNLYLCQECGLVHLRDVVNPELIYRNYLYETTTSLGLVEHFQKYAQDILDRIQPSSGSLVVEMGSNDGTLLNCFKKAGLRVLGVDPARDIARRATQAGVETWPEFFTFDLSQKIKEQKGLVDIFIANNVLANIDNLDQIMQSVRNILSATGVFIFETGYIVEEVKNLVFDYIYHEHISYFSVQPLVKFFKKHGMELIRVDHVPTKGGSIRGTVQWMDGPRKREPSVDHLVKSEIEQGYYQPFIYKDLTEKINHEKNKLLELLKKLKAGGKTIVGYGASPTVTTFMYYFEIANFLSFIIDDNPRKQNTLYPGNHIRVLDSKVIYEEKPDYILIMAWRYAEPIINRHQNYLKQKGRFIVPLPEFKVI